MKTFREIRNLSEDVNYHKAMMKHHDKWGDAHDHESNNRDGKKMEDHVSAHISHANAALDHRTAIKMHVKHGADSSQYKKARKAANSASREAHDDTKYAGPKFVTAGKPKHTTPTVKD